MPTVSAVVMCHPARRARAEQVRTRLAPLPASLVTDPDPAGPPATIRTARLAYARAEASDASHHLVVQDDVWVPDGFAAALVEALAAQPHAATSLFVEWGSRTAALVRLAALTGDSWVPNLNPYLPTQALALPTGMAREFAAFLAAESDLAEADDEAALRFATRAGLPILVCVPNLVEHVDVASLTGNAGHGVRRAACPMPDPPVPIGSTVLRPPERLPFLAWSTGTSITLTIVDGKIVDRRPTLPALLEHGAAEGRLRSAYQEALARGGRLVGVGEAHLWELWLTAAATGAVLRRRWPEVAATLPERLARPAAARAWATVAPGGLRLFADLDVLLPRAAELAGLAGHGLRFGAASLPGL